MKSVISEQLSRGRIREGYWASSDADGVKGAFKIVSPHGRELVIISSGVDSEYRWEHVSVSLEKRLPTWIEMSFVKDLFWDDEEVVMQLHPKKSEYVNCHPNCLHLWRPLDDSIPLPPLLLI